MIVNYDYYVNTYKGTEIKEEDFEKLEIRANNHVMNLIMNRDYTNWFGKDFTEQVKMAICSAIDILAKNEEKKKLINGIIDGTNKIVTSEKVGDYSRNFNSINYKDLKEDALNISQEIAESVSEYLWSTGLMNRGVCYVR